MGLKEVVEELQKKEACKSWQLLSKVEGIYELFREKEGVCKAKIYLNEENWEEKEKRFGCAYFVINPLNKFIDPGGKKHFSDYQLLKEYCLKKIEEINKKYFK